MGTAELTALAVASSFGRGRSGGIAAAPYLRAGIKIGYTSISTRPSLQDSRSITHWLTHNWSDVAVHHLDGLKRQRGTDCL